MATAYAGIGLCAAGVSPAGYGDPASADHPSEPVIVLSRNIDGQSKDYTLDDNGRTEQMNSAGQLVYLAMASITDWPKNIGANFIESVRNKITAALQPYVDAGYIEILSIQTTIKTSRTRTQVRWRDISTGQEFTIGLG